MIDSSSKESSQTALEERKRILSNMRKKGLKLSEDGLSWVPLEEAENNTKRIVLPSEENESSTLGALAPFLFICAFFHWWRDSIQDRSKVPLHAVVCFLHSDA